MNESAKRKELTRKLSLAPLSFEEAVTDLLKIKPESKPAKKKPTVQKRGSK